jgi:hypothetical protein
MNRQPSHRQSRSATGLVLAALVCGCMPGTMKRPPVPVPNVVPAGFDCASAFVDLSGLPVFAVHLTGEATFDAFLLETAQLQANSLVIERALAALDGPASSAGVDRLACASKEIQDAIIRLTVTGEALLERAPVVTSGVDDYCKAHPLGCLVVGKRLAEAGNQVRGSLQSLSRSSGQAGRLFSQAMSSK